MPSTAHPLLSLHQALAQAQATDLPDIAYEATDWEQVPKDGPRPAMADLPRITRHRRPEAEELEVTLYRQTWGSTALGYGGLGGAAMTSAYTVVVETRAQACVYFGTGPLAYRCVFADMTPDQLAQWRADRDDRQLSGRRQAVTSYGAVVPQRE